jgi:hypothetical protein
MASPFLRNQSPAPGDISVPLSTDIWLEVADSDSAIDGYSIIVTIDGQTAWQHDAYQAGFSATRWSISDGYRFLINPNCDFETRDVTVGVYAEDVDSNVLSTTYSFELDRTSIFEDDFNDDVQSIEYTPRNGNISESGGNINILIPDGINGDYGTTINNAPFAHVVANVAQEDTQELIYTAEIVNWSYISSNSTCGFNLFYGANPSQYAYYFEMNPSNGYLGLRYHENFGTNTFGSSTTIANPSVTPVRLRVRHNILDDLLTFEYSTDNCDWTSLGTRTKSSAVVFDRIGFYVKNWDDIRAVSASWNFLRIDEQKTVLEGESSVAAGFTDDVEFPRNVGTALDSRHTFPQNTETFNPTNEIEKGAGLVEDVEFPKTVGGEARHTFPQRAPGKLEHPVATGYRDGILVQQGSADIRAESQTTDSEAHPHFVGRQAYVSFFYDAYDDPWHDPVGTNHTGYARDGYKYTNGVLDGGPVYAPWASEAAGTDRSSRRDFPTRAMIVGTLSEVTIFDMDGYESTGNVDVWMRFRYGAGANYYQLGASDGRYVNDVMFKDGVLIAVSGQTTTGGLKIIDFRAEGQDFFSLIRSDDDWIGVAGRDITDRNTTGNHTTTGGTNVRIASEQPGSVGAVFVPRTTAGDYDEWYAVSGEDNTSLVHRSNVSGTKTTTGGLFQAQGDTSGSTRKVMFDKAGILWFSVDNVLHRNIYDYKDYSIRAEYKNVAGTPQTRVTLPYTITYLTDGPNMVFVGTTAGVYIVQKSDMSAHLAYTIQGGGGRGKNNILLGGELLVGENPEILSMRALTSDSIMGEMGFLIVATTYTADKSGGVSLIRMFDDILFASQEFPAIAEDGAYFPELIVF